MKTLALVLLTTGFLVSCAAPLSSHTKLLFLNSNPDIRQLSEATLAAKPNVGDAYIWGYYPGSGTKPRMYEAYLKLPDRAGKPNMALLTLFPDNQTPWVLHDGIAYDHEGEVERLSNPLSVKPPPLTQMFGWNAERLEWFPSTNHPNTTAHEEKFNYRALVIRDPNRSWQTRFACYDGLALMPTNTQTGSCDRGEVVFQQVPRDQPAYVFWPFYSLRDGVTLFKLFNDDATDPDTRVAMRLVYTADDRGERLSSDQGIQAFIQDFKDTRAIILEREAAGAQDGTGVEGLQ